MTEPDETALVIDAESRLWRRRLGPLAWAALEHLALAAHPDHHGWAAPLGVRDIAGGIGVTKDTAARAVTALRAAGLVSLEPLDGIDGRRRSGYRLHLPEGIQLRTCPPDPDSPSQQARSKRCPNAADNNSCPNNPDSPVATGLPPVDSAVLPPGANQPRRRRRETSSVETVQPALFDSSTPDPARLRTDGPSGRSVYDRVVDAGPLATAPICSPLVRTAPRTSPCSNSC